MKNDTALIVRLLATHYGSQRATREAILAYSRKYGSSIEESGVHLLCEYTAVLAGYDDSHCTEKETFAQAAKHENG